MQIEDRIPRSLLEKLEAMGWEAGITTIVRREVLSFLSHCKQTHAPATTELAKAYLARREAWRDSALVADPRLKAFEVQLGRVAPWPMVPEWEQIAIRLQEQSERAIRGHAPPDSVLSELDRDVELAGVAP